MNSESYVPCGELKPRTISGNPVDFRITMPYWLTSVGRFGSACAMRFCTLTWSMFGSVATSKVTTSCIDPSLPLIDCMYSMLSTPFICCSSGVATACSIVLASAPV
jgi:hypothetical protein